MASKYACGKCGAAFADNAHLRRHLARKTPCDPILAPEDAGKPTCRYCGRSFTSKQALSRHTLHRCKIANSEEGMEKLLEFTLRQQQASQQQMEKHEKETQELKAKIDRLTALLESLPLAAPEPRSAPSPGAATLVQHVQNVGTVTHQTNVTQNIRNIRNIQVNILPFETEREVHVPLEMVREAFAHNPRLREFCETGDELRIDAEKAAPYVLEALTDLIKRAHSDPEQRNVYLNPRRCDQVLVFVPTGRWEVITLVKAIRRLFDSVSGQLHDLVLADAERAKLSPEMQGAVGWVPTHYKTSPEKYVGDAKKSMAAHLENTRPAPPRDITA